MAALAAGDARVGEGAVRVQGGICLGDAEHVLLVGGEVLDLLRDEGVDVDRLDLGLAQLVDRRGVERGAGGQDLLALPVHRGTAQDPALEPVRVVLGDRQPVVDAPERRLHEAELVDLGVGRQGADETDVGTLGSLDRADPAVMAVVNVTDVEPGTLAAQPAGAEGAQPALVRQLAERVGLVHELGQLAGPEELLDRGDDWSRVDQGGGGDGLRVGDGHPLFDDPLHPDEAHPKLVLEQLAHRPDTPVAEVVDVIGDAAAAPVVELDEAADDLDEVALLEDPQLAVADALDDLLLRPAQALVDLVAADPAEVEAAGVEEEALEQVAGVVDRCGIARPDALVELDQGVVGRHRGVLLEGRVDVLVLGVVVDVAEELGEGDALGVAVVVLALQLGKLERLQEHRHRHLPLAVDLDREQVLGGGLDLEPGAPVGDQLGAEEPPAADRVLGGGEVDARRAHELGDDHPLGAVDDEGPLLGHDREVAHVDVRLLDLPVSLTVRRVLIRSGAA